MKISQTLFSCSHILLHLLLAWLSLFVLQWQCRKNSQKLFLLLLSQNFYLFEMRCPDLTFEFWIWALILLRNCSIFCHISSNPSSHTYGKGNTIYIHEKSYLAKAPESLHYFFSMYFSLLLGMVLFMTPKHSRMLEVVLIKTKGLQCLFHPNIHSFMVQTTKYSFQGALQIPSHPHPSGCVISILIS